MRTTTLYFGTEGWVFIRAVLEEKIYIGIDRSSLLKEPLVASFSLLSLSCLDGLLPMLPVSG
jgi:hypothetical protein